MIQTSPTYLIEFIVIFLKEVNDLWDV